jgi:hypothetical protein
MSWSSVAIPPILQVMLSRCVYQQGLVSFGVMLLSVVSDLGGYFTSFQCRSSYHPVASSHRAFRTDISFSNPPGLGSVFSFSLGHKDGGCWSVLGPLLSCGS